MYAQQKSYAKLAFGETTTVTSSMIWGSQWDQIMIWMRTVKNTLNTANGKYYVINAVGMGNHELDETGATKTTTAVEKTGNSENYKVKNIYDLAGNVFEWSLEAEYTTARVARGSFWDSDDGGNATGITYLRPSARKALGPTSSNASYTYIGSRCSIY